LDEACSEDEPLDVEAMDHAMGEMLAQHDLSDPEQRAQITHVFINGGCEDGALLGLVDHCGSGEEVLPRCP